MTVGDLLPKGPSGLGSLLCRDENLQQHPLQLDARRSRGRVIPQIPELLRIRLQIVQLAARPPISCRRTVVGDQLAAPPAQHRSVDRWVVGVPAGAVLAVRPAAVGRIAVAAGEW